MNKIKEIVIIKTWNEVVLIIKRGGGSEEYSIPEKRLSKILNFLKNRNIKPSVEKIYSGGMFVIYNIQHARIKNIVKNHHINEDGKFVLYCKCCGYLEIEIDDITLIEKDNIIETFVLCPKCRYEPMENSQLRFKK